MIGNWKTACTCWLLFMAGYRTGSAEKLLVKASLRRADVSSEIWLPLRLLTDRPPRFATYRSKIIVSFNGSEIIDSLDFKTSKIWVVKTVSKQTLLA